MRIALGIEYDGTGYNGWQRQKTGRGVQSAVEKAIASVADASVHTICAGRTDTGVHASGQVVHFDSDARRSERGWLLGINTELPEDINVTWARRVPEEFHARFSATSRTYRYLILNRLARSSLYRHRAWWIYEPLDVEKMHQAAQYLLGEHDFSSFRAAGCQASTPVREVSMVTVRRDAEWIRLTITANAFLQHMVRNIAGMLAQIGRGEHDPNWTTQVLSARDRKSSGIAAPAQGLTLTAVQYPSNYALPNAAFGEPFSVRIR